MGVGFTCSYLHMGLSTFYLWKMAVTCLQRGLPMAAAMMSRALIG
jgi:hypothetical protein